MWNNLFNSINEQGRSFYQPVVEFNQLVLRQTEKLAQAQLDSFNAYAAIGLKQLQAAAKVGDVEQLKSLANQQLEVMQALQNRVTEDVAKFSTLVEENRKEITGFVAERFPVVETAKPAAKASKAA